LTFVVNALIARLDEVDRLHLRTIAEEVLLTLDQVLCQPGEPMSHVYFPTHGFMSLVAMGTAQAGLEVAMVGREGMLGVQAVLGCESMPFRAVALGKGMAWRVAREDFQRHLANHPITKQLLERYATFRLNQLATLAQCLRSHEVGPRLARWLLMSHDRVDGDHFRVTQEALGALLGVRRVSVTHAANALQQARAIAYHRGDLQVLDRQALQRAACKCYRSDLKSYQVLFTDMRFD